MQPVAAVVPLVAVVKPATHATQSGLGMDALPPADHCPMGHVSQLGPPFPAAQMPIVQPAAEVVPVVDVVEPAGHATQSALGTAAVPPGEYVPRRQGAQRTSPEPGPQMVTAATRRAR